ncbi:FliH/SctL family protein, partial [Oceanobacter kriegii]|uniref:FliH/SctL family protein n=1 Tax=Oceanobacter kriegii TaxID=64972 RepID=UPI00055EC96B
MAGNDSHKQDQERELMFDKEGEQARPWKLPFWTEEVVHKAEREQPDTSLMIANRRRQPEPEPEPEIEEEIQLPTAEELENIRREAYNEGLEQGLVEGRQNGEKAGYDDGYAKGLETGKQEGEKAGNTIGFNEGKAEALKATGEQVEQLLDRFKALQQVASQSLIERDQQLPEMLAGLVMMACEQVLRYELADGAKNIHQYVRSALEQLPDGAEQQAKVFVSRDDASFLEGQLAEFGESLDFNIDPNLQAGECKVKTADSQVDYRVYDHLQQLLEQLAPALVQTVPDEETQAAELAQEIDEAVEQLHAEPEEPESAEPESAVPESAEPESAEPESAEPESVEAESVEAESVEAE